MKMPARPHPPSPTLRPHLPIQHYRSIKVPGWVYTNWKQAELALQRRGEAALSKEVLAPSICPACRTEMHTLEMKYQYRSCDRCGYTQQDLSTTSNFLGGMVLGVGLALLLQALSDGTTSQQPRKRAKRRVR